MVTELGKQTYYRVEELKSKEPLNGLNHLNVSQSLKTCLEISRGCCCYTTRSFVYKNNAAAANLSVHSLSPIRCNWSVHITYGGQYLLFSNTDIQQYDKDEVNNNPLFMGNTNVIINQRSEKCIHSFKTYK